MRKRLLIVAIVLMLVFTLLACTPKGPEVESPSEENPIGIKEPDKENPTNIIGKENGMVSYDDIVITAMEAFNIYRDEYPGALIKELELDTDFGSYIYKVKGYNNEDQIKIKIDPINGDIIDRESKKVSDNKAEITLAHVEKIQGLVDKSLLDAGENSMLDEWGLDWDNGVLELEIEIDLPDSREIEYTYNIETGDLIEKDE